MSYLVPVLFLIIVYFFILKIRPDTNTDVKNIQKGETCVNDFTLLYQALIKNGEEGDYWVVLIPKRIKADKNLVNIQMSKVNNIVGIDYVLNSEINRNNEEVFTSFARLRGYDIQSLNINDLKYLRIEGDGIDQVAKDFFLENFSIEPDTPLDMIVSNPNYFK